MFEDIVDATLPFILIIAGIIGLAYGINKLMILLIVVVVGLIFVVTLFTEFTVDRILQLISWAPLVIIFTGLLTIQGLLMLTGEAGGIWAFTGL